MLDISVAVKPRSTPWLATGTTSATGAATGAAGWVRQGVAVCAVCAQVEDVQQQPAQAATADDPEQAVELARDLWAVTVNVNDFRTIFLRDLTKEDCDAVVA